MIELSKIILLFNLRDEEKKEYENRFFERLDLNLMSRLAYELQSLHIAIHARIDGEAPRFMIYDAEALLLASLFLILLFSSKLILNKRCSKNQTRDKEYENKKL